MYKAQAWSSKCVWCSSIILRSNYNWPPDCFLFSSIVRNHNRLARRSSHELEYLLYCSLIAVYSMRSKGQTIGLKYGFFKGLPRQLGCLKWGETKNLRIKTYLQHPFHAVARELHTDKPRDSNSRICSQQFGNHVRFDRTRLKIKICSMAFSGWTRWPECAFPSAIATGFTILYTTWYFWALAEACRLDIENNGLCTIL